MAAIGWRRAWAAARPAQWRLACRRAFLLACLGAAGWAHAQATGDGAGHLHMGPPQRSVAEWLVRLQQASRIPSYVGTFVVSSSGAMSSSRIWHACEGDVQIEQVEALTGPPRTTFRRNTSVVTFLADTRTVRTDERESRGTFPNLLTSGNVSAIADFYGVRELGRDRVAGFDADVLQLLPSDLMRFGYRIWSERESGLVIKTQTLDAKGRVLEQSAFSELQLDAPVQADKLAQMMNSTQGYKVEKAERVPTTADAEGWALKSAVPGFVSQNCYRRGGLSSGPVVQWIFSDGLATVSLFIESFDSRRHTAEGLVAMGATHALTRRMANGPEQWWVTAVGEVPPRTLKAFVGALQRKH